MRLEGELGFVLHVRAWRETSLLVEVLSEQHGRVGLVARGLTSPRKQPLRAALQPLQFIRFDAAQRGELAQLRNAEALDAAPRLAGHAMLAGFYLNELVLRLAPRQDPMPEVYDAYAQARAALAGAGSLAWALRRFERDLLESLGFGFDLTEDCEGHPIDPAARYLLDPEQGIRRLQIDRGAGERRQAATGAALLALAHDREPRSADVASLRAAMRHVLGHHVGPRGLKSWELLDELSARR